MVRDRHRDWYVARVAEAAASLSGADQRRWLDRLDLEHDDIRAILDRAVAAPIRGPRSRPAFDMWRFWQKRGHLAEARRRLEAMAAAAWSHDDPRLRAKLCEALGGTCWWQGEIEPMTACYEEALAIWQDLDARGLGDDAELANAYYNASFTYAVTAESGPMAIKQDPDGIGLAYLEKARDIYHRIGDQRGEANALWGIGNYHYFRGHEGNGVEQFRQTLAMFGAVGDLTMEAWSLHMLGTGLLRSGQTDEARTHILRAIRQFYAVGDAAGLTLTLDDLSAVAVVDGDLPRAARLRGAARSLTVETGAQLAGFVEDSFEFGVRPGSGRTCRQTTSSATAPRARPGRSTRRSPTRSRATRRPPRRPADGVASRR